MKSQEITRRQEPIGEENADTARERKTEQGSIAHSFKQPPPCYTKHAITINLNAHSNNSF